MNSGKKQKWLVGIALVVCSVVWIGCGEPPQQSPLPPQEVKVQTTWRPLLPQEPFFEWDTRRLVITGQVALQKMNADEEDFLPSLFSRNNLTHYAFFMDGKPTPALKEIPAWRLFCGIISREDTDSGMYDLEVIKGKEDTLRLLENGKLSFLKGEKMGITVDDKNKRSLMYKHATLTGQRENSIYSWTGNFFCGVYADRIVWVEDGNGPVERADRLFWGEKKDATNLLKTFGDKIRYEIFAKKPSETKATD